MTTVDSGLNVSYSFGSVKVVLVDTSTDYDAYTRVAINPDALHVDSRGGCTFNCRLYYTLSLVVKAPLAAVYYGLSSNITTEPSWILIKELVGTGDSVSYTDIEYIDVPDNYFLFIRVVHNVALFSGNETHSDLTLQDGTIELPCTGTAIAEIVPPNGDSLTWNEEMINP